MTTALTTTTFEQPRFDLNLEDFEGPRAFDPKLLKKLARPKHALEHLKGALKRGKEVTDGEYRGLLLLALSEIGVAHGLLARREPEVEG